MKYYSTPTKMAIVKKKEKKEKKNKCWQECGETGALIHFWWEYKKVQLLWQTGIKQRFSNMGCGGP